MDHLLEQLAELSKTGKKLSDVKGFGELYETAFDLLHSIFKNDTAAILLKDSKNNTLAIAAARGYSEKEIKQLRSEPEHGNIGHVFDSGQPQLVTETVGEPRKTRSKRAAISEMTVPLTKSGEIVGVLDISCQGSRYSPSDLSILVTFGDQLASVIRHLKLKENIDERARKLVSISKAGQCLTSHRGLDQLLSRILESAREALDLDTCAVQLWDDEKENLVVVAAKGYDSDVLGLKIPKGTGVTGKVAAERRPSIIPDVMGTDNYIPGLKGCRSEMAVPLIFRDEVIGVLNAENCETDRFDETDLLHATIFADQAAGAIGNAQVHKEFERTRKAAGSLESKLGFLAATSEKVNGITDLDELMDEILFMTGKVLDVERIAVFLPEPSGFHLKAVRAHGYTKEALGLKVPVEASITGEAYREAKSLLVPDVSHDPRYVESFPGGRSEIAVPLKVGDDVVGVLDAESANDHELTEVDLQVMEMLAAQVSTALRNTRQRADLIERSRRLTLIHKAARSLNAMDDPEEMLDTILDLASEALGLNMVAILTPSEDAKYLTVIKTTHKGGSVGLKIPIGKGFVGTMFVTGKAGIISDVAQYEGYIPGTPGARSEMAVPLSLEGETIGILDAESKEPFAFTPTDLDMFRMFGSQVATALRNAQMIAGLKKREKRLSLLNKAARALNTIHNIDDLVGKILELAIEALDLDRCVLLLANKETKELEVNASIGYGDVEGKRIPLGKGITGNAALRGMPELVEDTDKDNRYIKGSANGRCEMAVPLLVMGEIIGVLDTESPNPKAFNQQDLELFDAFGAQAAVALHNAKLFKGLDDANKKLSENVKEMARLNKELEIYTEEIAKANENLQWQLTNLTAIHEAGKTITSSLDLDTTLETILKMTSRIVGSTAGAIKLIDEETKELKIRAESGVMSDVSASWSVFDLPLTIGDKTIGVFELVRKASEGLGDDERKMLETMASQAAIAIENARLFENTQRIYYETLKSLASALEAKDDYTRGHSERVAELSKKIARKLGLDDREIMSIYNAALLHDIGKIGIRDEVLLAPRKLTEEERRIIQKHPAYGNTILLPLKFLGEIREYVRYHHERWDGTGYPDGYRGLDIPLASRIIAVADTYDAMTSDRPYRDQISKENAIKEIKASAGIQFDPAVVDAFMQVMPL
jgi:putative nucleotidyltransferase with HDIG domain